MLKPTSAFVYVFQDASTSEEGACVALTIGVGEGDCVFCANELHDASTITKIRNMDRFLTLILLKKCLWTKPPNGWRYWCWAGLDFVWEQEKLEVTLREMLDCPEGRAARREAAVPAVQCRSRSIPEGVLPEWAVLGGDVVDESPIYALLANSRLNPMIFYAQEINFMKLHN